MTAKKLENNSNHAVIAEEVKILTDLLDESTRNLVGDDEFAKIKSLVKIAASNDHSQLESQIAGLSNQEMIIVARYFATLPLLINISEDVDLASEVNLLNNTKQDYLGKMASTVDLVAAKDNAAEILRHVNVVPVLTAHPTQVQRKTILELTDKIHNLLRRYRDVHDGTIDREEWTGQLRRYIEIIMQTDIIREKKLKVANEIKNVMVYYPNSLIPAITKLTARYKELAKERGLNVDGATPITMGMWIGGDRDGNPYVTAETLRLSGTIQSEVIFEYYVKALNDLYRTVSISTSYVQPTPEVAELARLSADNSPFRENEPYRRAFYYLESRLAHTEMELLSTFSKAAVVTKEAALAAPVYPDAYAFKQDLEAIKRSLVQNHDRAVTGGSFDELLEAIDVFGFHLATIDMRQDSSVNEAC
ncbi:phosphoenolpyruvate carboxylase, partial [Lactobacillus nasalidis]